MKEGDERFNLLDGWIPSADPWLKQFINDRDEKVAEFLSFSSFEDFTPKEIKEFLWIKLCKFLGK